MLCIPQRSGEERKIMLTTRKIFQLTFDECRYFNNFWVLFCLSFHQSMKIIMRYLSLSMSTNDSQIVLFFKIFFYKQSIFFFISQISVIFVNRNQHVTQLLDPLKLPEGLEECLICYFTLQIALFPACRMFQYQHNYMR